MIEYNNCDKCGVKEDTLTLNWIDAEDFEPLDSDKFDDLKYKNALKKYSALCDECYKEECCKDKKNTILSAAYHIIEMKLNKIIQKEETSSKEIDSYKITLEVLKQNE